MNATDELKQLRIGIDRIAELVRQLAPSFVSVDRRTGKEELAYFPFPEIASCRKSLLYAKCWVGCWLGELGNETPYKNDGNIHDVKDIEPTDAKSNTRIVTEASVYGQKNHIEKVDYLRQEIKKCIDIVKDISYVSMSTKDNVWRHLCEARFGLGFELERIANEI